MKTEGKPLAPRPVRKTSHLTRVKLESSFDQGIMHSRIHSNKDPIPILNNPFGPKKRKIKNVIHWNSEEIFHFENNEKVILDLDFESEISQIKQNYSNENAKSEILQILNSKDSPIFRNSSQFYNTASTGIFEEESTGVSRISNRPERTSNPFLKNFTSDNFDVVDFNLVKYNSTHLFKNSSKDFNFLELNK